jgi:glutaminyl-tRNA synthetase
VQEGIVSGWDDPRMPTLSGLRRRGYTSASIRDFMSRIGVAKTDSLVDVQLLEHCIREELNKSADRVMAVLHPLKLVIENWPEGKVEEIEAVNNPEDPSRGARKVPFSKVLYIEREDFAENPPPKYFRLFPGNMVRLRYAYIVTCTGFTKDPSTGEITELRCSYDPATKGGDAPDNRKVKGTIHWVSAEHAIPIEARLYDHLFPAERPMDVPTGVDWVTTIDAKSLEKASGAFAEPSLASAKSGDRYQFERLGYFCCDPDSRKEALVFNRTVGLRDTWAKIGKKA